MRSLFADPPSVAACTPPHYLRDAVLHLVFRHPALTQAESAASIAAVCCLWGGHAALNELSTEWGGTAGAARARLQTKGSRTSGRQLWCRARCSCRKARPRGSARAGAWAAAFAAPRCPRSSGAPWNTASAAFRCLPVFEAPPRLLPADYARLLPITQAQHPLPRQPTQQWQEWDALSVPCFLVALNLV